MNNHEPAIIACILMLVCFSNCDYAGLSFKLTRSSKDKFQNPTATRPCNWKEKDKNFCQDANSRCDRNCCQCTCDDQTSTFDRNSMKCQTNKEFRFGCKVNFKNVHANSPIKVLDLTKKGGAEINWPAVWGDKVKSFSINSVKFYRNGSEIPTTFLHEKGNASRKDGKWIASIEWDKVSNNSCHGKIFRVELSYEIKKPGTRSYVKENHDCFVFKSKGSITVTYPSVTSTALPSPATEKSTSPSVKTIEPSGKEGGTFGARKDDSGGGNNAVTVSLAVVGCLLLVAIVLLLLWLRRRSAKALNEKNGAPVDASRSVDNPMMISQMENIYAEADDTNYPDKGKDNVVCAEGNLKNYYASLDMNKVESVPTYELLTDTQNNMIPAKDSDAKSPKVVGLGAQTPIAEPLYHVVDEPEEAQDPGEINHVLEEPEETGNCKTREIPARSEHEDSNRVYSTLEEEDTPEICGREVPGRTGYDDTERVYSVLEDETAE